MSIIRHVNFDVAVASVTALTAGLVLGEAATRSNIKDAQSPRECRYPPLTNILTESHVRELEEKDIVVIKNVLSAFELKEARICAQSLSQDMVATENDVTVRQDMILSIRENDKYEHGDEMIHCMKLLRGIPYILNRFHYSKNQPKIVPRQCQLSHYLPDGSSYVRHLDRCKYTLGEMGLLGWLRASDHRYRVVTAILYLNAPNWKNGGELRYYEEDNTLNDIIPMGGTLVIFDSSKVEHQVLPSTADRYALTCWFNGIVS